MKSDIKFLKSIAAFLTITIFIPLLGCGSGLGGLLDNPGKIPVSPANVQATKGIYPDKVTITWSPSAGANSYSVYRADASDGYLSYTKIASNISGLIYDDTSVSCTRNPFTYYLYKVTAVNRAGDSGVDSPMTLNDQGYADPWKAQNYAPDNITATDGTLAGKVNVKWDTKPGVSYYRVYRSPTSSGQYELVKDNISATTCDINSVAGTTYWFKVSGVDASGESALSLPDAGHAMSLPLPPASVTASDTSYHYVEHIHIVWSAGTGEGTISGYRIYGSDSPTGTYTLLNTTNDLFYDEAISEMGRVRYYKIASINEAGTGAPGDYVSGQTWGRQPAAPGGISTTQGSFPDKVTISWSASDGASGYRVYRSDTSNGIYTQVDTDLGNVLTYDDLTGVQGTHYFYKVSAFSDYGESIQSENSEGWKLAPPQQVTGVFATDGSEYRKITITWDAPSGLVTSYNIYKSDTATGTYNVIKSGITTLNYTDDGALDPDVAGEGIHRFYKVCAVNAAGSGTQSVENEGSTMIAPSIPQNVSTSIVWYPSATEPGGGHYEAVYDDKIVVSWTASSNFPEYYDLYIYTKSDLSDSPTIITGITNLYYEDMVTGTLPITHYYEVLAGNAAGESSRTASVMGFADVVTAPTIPPTINATQGTIGGSIHVRWDPPISGGASGYNVYRSSTSGGTYDLITSSPIGFLYYDDPTAPGVHWFYKVSAVNHVGDSGMSSYAEGWAMLLPSQVTGITSSGSNTTTSITFSWTEVSDIQHYNIYRADSLNGTYILIADDVNSATYTDSSGLDASHHWFYKVSAVNPAGEGTLSAAYEGWLILSAPAGVSASQGTYLDRITLTWNETIGATGYMIYSSTDDVTYNLLATVTTADYTDYTTGNFYYKIKAFNNDSGADSDFSTAVYGSLLNLIPENVVATQGTLTDRVRITWNTFTDAVYYKIYRSETLNGTYTLLNTANVTDITYDDTTIYCSNHYFYKVKAVIIVNELESESNFSTASEGWASPVTVNPPENVSATDGLLVGQITVTWTASENADYYDIYRSSSSDGTYAKINTSAVTGTTYTNTGIATGAHWFYKVTSNSNGCGGSSVLSAFDEGYAKPIPGIPSGVAATDKANAGLESDTLRCNATNASNGIDGVTISWTASSNASYYNVYRSDPATDGSGTYGSYTKINSSPIPSTTTTFLDDYGQWDLNPSTYRRLINVYRYTVTAVNDAGESAQSSYDEGSAQITTAEFFTYMFDMPMQYSWKRAIQSFDLDHTVNYQKITSQTKSNTLSGAYSGQVIWVLTGIYEFDFYLLYWRSILKSEYTTITFSSICDYKYASNYTSSYIYTDSIHNYKIYLNGKLRGDLDISNDTGWINSIDSNNSYYCTGTCSTEPGAPTTGTTYWPVSVLPSSYSSKIHTISVDSNSCYGWVIYHGYTAGETTRASQSYSWVSYRGQRPVRMYKTTIGSNYNEYGCP